ATGEYRAVFVDLHIPWADDQGTVAALHDRAILRDQGSVGRARKMSVARVPDARLRLHGEKPGAVERKVKRTPGGREHAGFRVDPAHARRGLDRGLERGPEVVGRRRDEALALGLVAGRADIGDIGRDPIQ